MVLWHLFNGWTLASPRSDANDIFGSDNDTFSFSSFASGIGIRFDIALHRWYDIRYRETDELSSRIFKLPRKDDASSAWTGSMTIDLLWNATIVIFQENCILVYWDPRFVFEGFSSIDRNLIGPPKITAIDPSRLVVYRFSTVKWKIVGSDDIITNCKFLHDIFKG